MTLELQVNGRQYTQFISAQVERRLDALSNTFSFEATSENGNPLPFTGGESCRVIANGETILTGRIEIVQVSYNQGLHNIGISGRDKTGDLLDSTLDSISDISPPISLKGIIEKVIQQLGVDIEVIDNARPEEFNKAEDLISPEPGENAFQFIEKFARKRQVLLTSDGDGNIVITQSSGQIINSPIRHKLNSNENNVTEAQVSYDTTGRYNVYKFASSLNPIALNAAGDVGLGDLVDQSESVTDSQIASGRQLILISENPYSDSQNKDRATWEANVRKARGRVYTATLDGFDNRLGDLWDINKIVSIVDDFCGINARMLINSVVFTYNLSGGSKTILNFVDQNAYTLSLSEPRTEELGNGLFS